MKRTILAIAALAAACGGSAPAKTKTTTAALLGAPTAPGLENALCNDPRDFGAVVDDQQDDRANVQAAIDAACTNHKPVCLPIGGLRIERNLVASGANAIPSLVVECDSVTITGLGDGSLLEMAGTGMRAGSWGPGDWTLIAVRARGTQLLDFRIDGGGRTNTGEQTHLVQLQEGATDTLVERVTTALPILTPPAGAVKCMPDQSEADYLTRMCHVDGSGDRLCKDLSGAPKCIPPEPGTTGTWNVAGWYSGGDCFRMLGSDNPANGNVAPIERSTFRDVHALDCDRSCWGVQRAVYDTLLDNDTCLKVGDQAIDQEPTGVGTIRRFVVRGGKYNGKITLTGNGPNLDGWASNLLDSVTINGPIFAYQAADTELRNLVVTATDEAAVGVIKDGESFKIEGGRYTRSGTVTGPVVSFTAHSGRWPTDAYIGGGARLVQLGEGPVLRGDPLVGLDVDGAILECKGPAANAYAGVIVTSLGVRTSRVKVRGAEVRGNCKYGVQVQGGTTGAGSIIVTGNVLEVQTSGVRIDGATPVLKPTIDGNVIGTPGAATTGLSAVSPGTVVFTGTNNL